MATVKDLTVEELRRLIQGVVRETLDEYLEDREALGSREYLDSIEEAREEYRRGETVPLRDLGPVAARDQALGPSGR